jgi:SAM-dependent methyltransferase
MKSETNFADLDARYDNDAGGTPRQLVGMYPLGGGGIVEASYRHYFELRHLKKIVAFSGNMNVLELGCGNGRWAVSLAPIVKHYTGVDITRRALDIAREDLSKYGVLNVDLHEQSVLDFQGDRHYDVVYFSAVSQYLEDDELDKILGNLRPWLKRNMTLVDRSTVNYVRRENFERPGYYSIFRTKDDLCRIYGKYGFRIVYSARSYRFLRCGRRFNSSLLRKPFLRIIELLKPVSLNAMLAFTVLVDTIAPLPPPLQSHDFLVFKRKEQL